MEEGETPEFIISKFSQNGDAYQLCNISFITSYEFITYIRLYMEAGEFIISKFSEKGDAYYYPVTYNLQHHMNLSHITYNISHMGSGDQDTLLHNFKVLEKMALV